MVRVRQCAARVALIAVAVWAMASCTRERPDDVGPVAHALLRAGGVGEPTAALDQLAFVAGRVQASMRRQPTKPPLAHLREVLFDELGFVREVEEQDESLMLLPSVLASRRGSCIGLGLVYLALGERLGLHMSGVLVPGHFFVRVNDARGSANVELLRRGQEMPDAWYLQRYALPIPGASAYMRPLSTQEVLAVIDYNLGNDARAHGDLAKAKHAYVRAAAAFPAFAEAHANLGMLLQLQGDLVAAEREYQAARAANPALAGLDENLQLLDAERRMPGLTPPSAIR